MGVTREELAAFADGELDPARAAEVAAAVAADPALASEVRAHRALRERLGAHFAPVMDAPPPERLISLLTSSRAEVSDLAVAREKRARAGWTRRWGWIAAPALAASLALAVLQPREPDASYADSTLAAALDGQLVATQDNAAPIRILLSFQDGSGAYCRAFAGETRSGIACRDVQGWHLRMSDEGVADQAGDYRMAGNPTGKVLERAQAMASGPALDAAGERAARARGWR